ncbi:MAG: cation diffusion facilitator family transporter [bacterium]
MSEGHGHDHTGERNIASAFFLNLFFIVVEIIGGLITGSFAILSDALHDFGDTLSLAISWYLERVAKKGKDARFSFGYRRFSLLAALINSIVLLVGGLFILSEVIPRLLHPHHSSGEGMIILAVFGISVHAIAAYRLRKGKSLNEKTVSLHLLEDVFGWIAVLIAGLLISIKDLHVIDPLLSALITVYILWKVFRSLKETLKIFLQGVPPEVKIDQIQKSVMRIKGVKAMCDTNIWSLDGVNNVMSTHVVVEDTIKGEQIFTIKNKIKDVIAKNDIQHVTIEIERCKERTAEEMKLGRLVIKKPKVHKFREQVGKLMPKTLADKIVVAIIIITILGVIFYLVPESEEHEHDPNTPIHQEE